MAIKNARDVYTRRSEGISIWVTKSNSIFASKPGESDSLYEPSDSKIYRHPTFYDIPDGIKITVEKQTIIKISGVDKELVSKIAADIKSFKPVEPYKAKGIKERGQFVLRKEGKKK